MKKQLSLKQVTKQFAVRPGSPVPVAKAQEVGELLENISKSNKGKITPQDLVKEGKKKKSPLHECFDWDDGTAASKWRIQQARMIMSSIYEVEVEIINDEEVKSEPQKVYFSVKDKDKKKVYVTAKRISRNKGYRNQLIKETQKQMENLNRILNQLMDA